MSLKEIVDTQLNNIQQHVESAVVNHSEYFQQVLTRDQYNYLLQNIIGDKYILSILMSSSLASIIAGFFYLFGKGSTDSRKQTENKKTKKKKKKNNNNHSKKNKKETIAGQTLKKNSELEIENVLKLVDEEILPKIEEYENSLKKFNDEKINAITGKNQKSKSKKKNAKSAMSDLEYDHEKVKESINYLYLYIEEYLLKKLMKLDDLDLYGDADLRLKRKGAIKYIQGLHKKIDELKTKYYIGTHIPEDSDSISTTSIAEEDQSKNN